MHTNSITLADQKLRTIAAKRYENQLKNSHKLLHDLYAKQKNEIVSKNGKFKW